MFKLNFTMNKYKGFSFKFKLKFGIFDTANAVLKIIFYKIIAFYF